MTELAGGRRERRKSDTRGALEDAALRRFARDGYDRTSVDAIAADAGVSTRTFFRYFVAKDEVLDMGRDARQEEVRAAVRAADGGGLDLVRAAVLVLAAGFVEDRERVVLRRRAVASSPLLRGRLLDTLMSWEEELAGALTDRGLDDARTLAAVGLAVFRTAVTAWLEEPEAGLADLVEAGFGALS